MSLDGAEFPCTVRDRVTNLLCYEPVGEVMGMDGRPRTATEVRARKGGPPLVMVTAYDAPSARTVDAAGADIILVGDSVAMVVLGYDDTLEVTIDDMARHVAAVHRAKPGALIVGDLPWLSYHGSHDRTLDNVARLVRAGAGAVKLEGGAKRLDTVRAILDAEVPVMGHLGLTPQSLHALGGFKVQGQELNAAKILVDDARALVDAGVFALVLECVPDAVARTITDEVSVPTIGIGAGRHVDGQVLVWHDLLGFSGADRPQPRFVRQYAQLEKVATTALGRFCADVRAGTYPSSKETYHLADRVLAAFAAETDTSVSSV